MPFDDEPDEPSGFQPPLPPDDRLWRHPSELGPAGAAAPITIIDRPRPSGRTWVVGVLSAIGGAAAMVVALAAFGVFDQETTTPPVERVQIEVPKNPGAEALTIADQVRPSVVHIEANAQGHEVTGAGVVFRTDGHILTSADAVDGADSMSVVFDDGQSVPGEIVGIDHENDVAVVKVPRTDVPAAAIGQPEQLKLGESTIVVSPVEGHPGAPVIGEGLVSGLERRVDFDHDASMYGMIQTNVRLSTDATGAPLVDTSGAIVGVVSHRGANRPGGTANDAGSRTDPEIWYATPVDWAKQLADQWLTSGKVVHVWLGVGGSDLSQEESDQLGRGGAKVLTVSDASPASTAGLQPNDVVTAVDQRPVTSMSELVTTLRKHQPGDAVALSFRRNGEEQVALVALAGREPKS